LGKKANVNRISGKTNGNARKKWFKGFSPVEKKIWKGFFAWQFRPFLLLTEKLNCQKTEVIR
jgi:hypothetical protein